MGNVMRFTFHEPTDLDTVEQDMALALLVAEFLYGKPRVRLEASYNISAGDGDLTLDVSGPAGETAAQIFTGFCTVRFGEEGYQINRCRLTAMTFVNDILLDASVEVSQ
jgi:hypothetical protein